MAKRKTGILIKKICFWGTLLIFAAMIGHINWQRFNHNIFANYEKAVEYGRVRETKNEIKPVIAAIFYSDKNMLQDNVTMYLNHSANYKKKHVKIVIVPKFLNQDSIEVVERLYREIRKYNKITKIALVHAGRSDLSGHATLLDSVIKPTDIVTLELNKNEEHIEKAIESYLQQPQNMVVMLTNLTDKNDILVDKAINFAQKYHFNMNVFDVIDTQIAQALEKDYSALFAMQNNQEQPLSIKQKYNLQQYVQRYGISLWYWFNINLARSKDNLPPMWPLKSEDTYRLYDRGTLYAKSDTFEKVVDNTGIVVALVRMAQRFVHKNIDAKNVKLYLLTDKEEIIPQVADLDVDDGVYLFYKGYKSLILANERPTEWTEIISRLKSKAGIIGKLNESEFKYYKFKAVEIKNEN